ncbi:MAG: MBL fold metallo-hydrolase [Hyphomicrobiales bacterium]
MTFTLHSSASVSAWRHVVDRTANWRRMDFPIRFGLFEHGREGLVLVDTGYSPQLFESRDPRVVLYRGLLRPQLNSDGDALAVVKAHGGKASDVRHIVLTHLHADHICGLARFPRATLMASDASLAGWRGDGGFSSFHKGFFPSLLPDFSATGHRATSQCRPCALPWGGEGRDLLGDGSIIAVHLPGHMKGHMGLFFPVLAQPTLHAADADWHQAGLDPALAPSLAARLVSDDLAAVQASKAIIAKARAWGAKITLCHDGDDA